ncbi:MAG: hypothetical protein GY711_08945 [bacterium]|nr:hypothetical protein [bacterium]
MVTITRDGFQPGGTVAGDAFPPGSKSIAQRALVCAAWATGRSRIGGLPSSDDVRHTQSALASAGVHFESSDRPVGEGPGGRGGFSIVTGQPPGPHAVRATLELEVNIGESGTGARLVTGSLALCAAPGTRLHVRGGGSLLRRTSPALFRALAAAGIACDHGGLEHGWPVRLTALGPPSEILLEDPSSSQEISALLIALAAYPGYGYVRVRGPIPSLPYVGLTRAVLGAFSVHVEEESEGNERTFVVRGPLVAPDGPFEIEPDASAAAVALAAGCLGGGEVRVPGLGVGSAQGDVRIVEHLSAFGCTARAERGALVASGFPAHGAELDLAGEPDLAPVLAAVAGAAALAGAGGSRLTGLETLPGKESSRIEVLARGLAALGLEVEAGAASLAVERGTPHARPISLDAEGDHRMAFAFALLGLVREDLDVLGPECVAKSWPGFWTELERLGASRRSD